MFGPVRIAKITFLFFSLAVSGITYAQAVSTESLGIVPGGSYQSSKVDAVNVQNGNAVIRIPLFSLPQLGQLSLSYSIVANTTAWQATYYCDPSYTTCSYYYYTTADPGTGDTQVNLGASIVLDQEYFVPSNSALIFNPCGNCNDIATSYWVEDSTKALHPLFYDATDHTQLRSIDGTKFLYSPASGSLTDSQGIKHYTATDMSGNQVPTISDADGNAITFGSGGITDSVGRTITGSSISSSTTGCPDLSSQATYQPAVGSSQLTVPGPNGKNAAYLICYATIAIHTNFWGNNGQDITTHDQPSNCNDPNAPTYCYGNQYYQETVQTVQQLIQSVVLPDKTYWGFVYDAADPNNSSSIAYGTINKLIMPTGGVISYQYKMADSVCVLPNGSSPTNNFVYWNSLHLYQRTEADMNGNTYLWTYDGWLVTDPNHNDTLYTFEYTPEIQNLCRADHEVTRQTYNGPWNNGQGQLVRTVATTNQYSFINQPYAGVQLASVSQPNVATTLDGFTTVSNTTYDSSFQAAFVSTYLTGPTTTLSLGIPKTQSIADSSGATAKTIQTNYKWEGADGSSYRSANLLDTPNSATTLDGNGIQVAQTTTKYDEAAYSSGCICGHPTTTTMWNNNGADIQTHIGWVSATGMVDYTVDANQVKNAQFTYGSQYHGLYPTIIKNALGQQTSYTYDFNTGKIASSTDPNTATTSYFYYDNGHLKEVQFPDSGDVQYTYSTDQTLPTAQTPITVTKTIATGETSGPMIEAAVLDGLGRTVQTQLKSSGTTYVDTKYDGLDQVIFVSNPHLAATSYDVTSYAYDAVGRKQYECNPDNGTTATACAPGSSYKQWTYAGNLTTFIDELHHSWQRTTDVLGRLTNVVEPGSLTTAYQYNVLGDLTCVDQWENGTIGKSCTSSRPRSFSYDSLSRLTSATNPETGTIGYAYLLNRGGLCAGDVSLPCSKTDALGIMTNYTYDALNRITAKSYLNDLNKTPSTCFLYDANGSSAPANAIGRLTAEWTQSGTCPGNALSLPASGFVTAKVVTSYDAMGRLLTQQTCVLTNCTQNSYRPQSFSHDLAGKLTGFNDGWGLQSFTQSYDAAGRLQFLTSSWSDPTHPPTLYGVQNYGSIGVLNATMGNHLTITKAYDSRERITNLTVQGVH
jgi:YD repeat-containing protein